MTKVIIGVDPHKLSATIEVVDGHERLLGSGRFSTDQAGYTAMRSYAKNWPQRVWAIEGSNGAGRPLAQRLLEAGEHVVDVPAKLAARVRLFDTGHNRKTDARDAHSIAIVAVRTTTLRVLRRDGELEALRMLCDRREELTRLRVQTVNRLQRLLAELVPGQAKKHLTALQAKAILATVRPRDIAGNTRRRIAAEELADLVAVEAKGKKATAELKILVKARGSRLMDLHGVGPVVAARTLADVGDIARFADRNRFASWTGTAPLDASSGEQNRHRLPRAGNRRMNHMIHIAAISQIRLDTDGRAYYRRKRAAGKTTLESLAGSERTAGVHGSLSGLDPGVYTVEAAAPRSLNGPSDLVVISVPPAMDPGKLLIGLGALVLVGALLRGLAANHRAVRYFRALGSLALICLSVVVLLRATGASLRLERPPELAVDAAGGNHQPDPPKAGTVLGPCKCSPPTLPSGRQFGSNRSSFRCGGHRGSK